MVGDQILKLLQRWVIAQFLVYEMQQKPLRMAQRNTLTKRLGQTYKSGIVCTTLSTEGTIDPLFLLWEPATPCFRRSLNKKFCGISILATKKHSTYLGGISSYAFDHMSISSMPLHAQLQMPQSSNRFNA